MGVAGNRRRTPRFVRGQMTVELAVCIPVLVAMALVVFNALSFLGSCAAFDRVAKDAVRIYACSPAHGQSTADGAAIVQARLDAAFPDDCLDVSVASSGRSPGFVTYTATLSYSPTLFGRTFTGVFGISLGRIDHTVRLVVDPYRPGAIL